MEVGRGNSDLFFTDYQQRVDEIASTLSDNPRVNTIPISDRRIWDSLALKQDSQKVLAKADSFIALEKYKPRTNGNMNTVLNQGVRNYHWEYYREMNDVRNDMASAGLVKNPYLYPLAYGTFDKNLENNKWYKLQFLQVGSKIIGALMEK